MQARLALEKLVIDNAELDRLEARLGRFNLFEAAGLVRHEIRHSSFLAFLLDPNQPHGLGDSFLKGLLQEILSNDHARTLHVLSPLDLHLADLSDSHVQREWQNIDIIVRNDQHRVFLAIENKIGSGEHSRQLERYRDIVERELGEEWNIILCFLAPDIHDPSDDQYIPLSYDSVHTLLAKLLARYESNLGADFALVARHYLELLATHVINDPALDKLCNDIYQKHKIALDLIFQKRASPRAVLRAAVDGWISAHSNEVVADSTGNAYIRFVPNAWLRFSPVIGSSKGGELHALYVLVTLREDQVWISIEMREGGADYRERIYSIVSSDRKLFNQSQRALTKQFFTPFSKKILSPADFEKFESEELAGKVVEALDGFNKGLLPQLTKALTEGWSIHEPESMELDSPAESI